MNRSNADNLKFAHGSDRPVAMVTGSAAPRVGHAVIEHFAHRGYRVVVHAHGSVDEGKNFVRQLQDGGTEALLITGAVEDENNVRRWMEEVFAHFGRLDVLVNCAAIWEPCRFEDTSSEDVLRHVRINSLGSFICAQQAGLFMSKQETGGAIIQVGDSAIDRPYVDFSGYFVSKGVLPTLTRMLAVELASRNPRIRVNAVMPGPILLLDDTPESTREAIARQTLANRVGTPEDLCQAIAFLAETTFVTGVCLPVDGGRSIYAEHSSDAIAHPKVYRSSK